jgi:hypothetical protein
VCQEEMAGVLRKWYQILDIHTAADGHIVHIGRELARPDRVPNHLPHPFIAVLIDQS